MIKLYINKSEQTRFKSIFNFLADHQSKVYITPQGIDFTHQYGQGSINKEMFLDFNIQGTKCLSMLSDKKQVKNWIKSWKDEHKWKVASNGRVVDVIEISI